MTKTTRRSILAAGAAALALPALLGSQAQAITPAEIKAKGKIVVGIQGDNPPWGFVTSAGKRFWSTSTSGKHVRLVLGTSGRLQLMSGKRVLWHAGAAISYGTRDNPAPAARLAAGASLTAGHSLASYRGG